MDILDLLRREICRESIAHAPRVPGSVEAMRLAIEEIERLRPALLTGAEQVEKLAFSMRPPNPYTPQFVMLANGLRRLINEAGERIGPDLPNKVG